VNVLGERNEAKDGVDVQDRDAVFAIDDEPNDFDSLHDAGERIEPLLKRHSTSIRARRELANDIRMKGKRGGVVVPHFEPFAAFSTLVRDRVSGKRPSPGTDI
jgi:hypothetical protein